MKKKFLVVLLALAMVFAFGATALAAEITESASVDSPVSTNTANVTVTVKIAGAVSGTYYQLAIGDAQSAVVQADGTNLTIPITFAHGLSEKGKKTGTWEIELFSGESASVNLEGEALTSATVDTIYYGNTSAALTKSNIVVPSTGSYKYGIEVSNRIVTIYTTNNSDFSVTVNPSDGATAAPKTVTVTTAGVDVDVTPENGDTSKTVTYTLKRVTVNPQITYHNGSNKTSTQYKVSSNSIAINAEVLWAQIEDGAGNNYSAALTGTGVSTGSATLPMHKVELSDKATSVNIVVSYGGTKFVDTTVTLLRPIISSIYFNDANKSTGGDSVSFDSNNKATFEVDSDWEETLYFTVKLLNGSNSNVEVSSVEYDGSTRNVSSVSSGTMDYSFDFDEESGLLVIEVTAGISNTATGLVRETYEVLIAEEGYTGSALTAFYANDSRSTTGGFVTVLGKDTIYVFVPYDYVGDTLYFSGSSADKDDIIRYYSSNSATGDEGDRNGWFSSKTLTKVVVEDENGFTTEYKVEVIDASKNADDDALLSKLVVESGTSSSRINNSVALNPNFDSKVMKYTVSLDDKQTHIKFTPTLSDKNAMVFVNGEQVNNNRAISFELDSKNNKYEILVVAEDGEETETYTVSVNDNGTLLKALSINGAASGVNPAFNAERISYTAYATSGTNAVNISATANSADATVSISGGSGGSASTKGSANASINLAEGMNTIRVTVAESGQTTSVYYISVYKQPANPNIQISKQQIVINNGATKTLNAYNINGNNFIQLRDLADLLNGTSAQFEISFNDASQTATLTTEKAYTRNGTENAAVAKYTRWENSKQSFYLNNARFYPAAYNIDGSNYVMVRDLANMLNVGVTFNNATQTISINTANDYVPGN